MNRLKFAFGIARQRRLLLTAMVLAALVALGLVVPITALAATDCPGLPRTPQTSKHVPLPPEKWTCQERWVWERIREGKVADFNDATLPFNRGGGVLDPSRGEDWRGEEGARRLLRSSFLETILLNEPWRSAIPHPGVIIKGVLFKGDVDLDGAELGHPLLIVQSRVEGSCILTDSRQPFSFSLSGTCITGLLDAHRFKVKGSLFLDGGYFTTVNLLGLGLGGQLSMINAEITGSLDMDGAKVADSIFLNQSRFVNGRMRGVEVGGQFIMVDVTIKEQCVLDGTKIAGYLRINKGIIGSIRLPGVAVGGQVSIRDTKFVGPFYLDQATIKNDMFLASEFVGNVYIMYSLIGGNLNLQGAKFASELNLSGTKTGMVFTRSEDWPAPGRLRLNGLTYDYLGEGYNNRSESFKASLPSSWFIDFLGRQKEHSPQPYEQCAKILRQTGQSDTANAVLFDGKVRECGDAFARGNYIRGIGLALMIGAVGHGIGIYSFFALGWVALFGAGGAWAAHRWPPHNYPRWGWRESIIYSLQVLLPFLKPSKEYEQTDFRSGLKVTFFILNLIGWLLAFFVVAGLTGLTRKP